MQFTIPIYCIYLCISQVKDQSFIPRNPDQCPVHSPLVLPAEGVIDGLVNKQWCHVS